MQCSHLCAAIHRMLRGEGIPLGGEVTPLSFSGRPLLVAVVDTPSALTVML